MTWIRSLVVFVASVAFVNALNVSDFSIVAPGVAEDWAKASADNVKGNESFGLVYGSGDKVWLVSRRHIDGAEDSAVRGGIVSRLDMASGKWSHMPYDRLDEDKYREDLFSLKGRLFLLSNVVTDKIVFGKLYAFDDEQGKWMEIPLEKDEMANQPLSRGPANFTSVNVPDLDKSEAYVIATDHQMALNDSETSFSKLSIVFDGAKPVNASLKAIAREKSPLAQAALYAIVKDDLLHVLVAHFDNRTAGAANFSIGYAINLKDGKRTDGAALKTNPIVDPTKKDRISQLQDKVIFIGPHRLEGDKMMRTVHLLDLPTLAVDTSAAEVAFPSVVNRVFSYSQGKIRIFTASLVKGLYAANVA